MIATWDAPRSQVPHMKLPGLLNPTTSVDGASPSPTDRSRSDPFAVRMLRRTNSGQSIRSVAASPSMPRAAPVSEYAAQCGFDIGDRVLAGSGKAGICRFIGETEFAAGLWAGIELTSGVGKNDGSVQGKRYFECDQPKGLFILASKVTKAPTTGPSHFAVRHNKTSVLRQSGLQRSGSRESLASIGASSVASSRIFTPKIVRKPNVNLNIGNSYDKTIKTLQESLKEKENHIDRLLHEREADQVEIARLSGMKCMSPSSTTSSTSDERVKELEAEVSRLTNELLKKSAALEELTFTLEEERATTEARLAELESQLNELKSKESIEIDIPEVMTPAETDSEASSQKGSKKRKDKKKRKNSGLFTGLSMVMFRDFTFNKASNEEIEELRNQIEQQKNEIESHINQMQSLGSDYAQAMEQCVLLEANLSDEANEKLKLIKRCETTEALRADLQAQLDGDTSQLVKEKDELQEAVDRLNSAVTQQDQAIQSERQQTKMLQKLIEQQKNEIETHANRTQGLSSDYAEAMEKCVLLERKLSDEANEKLELIKRCETSEARRAELQAQLDGDTSQLVKEKDELQKAVDRLNSAVTQQDQAIQSERQQTKMLQELIEQQKNEIETHANRTQGLSSDYAEAMEKCVLLEAKLSDEANEKLELIKRCETSEALRAELQAQLDGDTSQLVKEKDELQKAVDRLNSAVTQQDQAIQSERQQTKMLQELTEEQKNEIETHVNRTQGLSSDYAQAMEKCVLLEAKLSDEANEKLELIKRCETSEALRAELQAQLDGDTSQLVKEKDEIQKAVDRLNSAVTQQDQVIQSERQQTKMLQELIEQQKDEIETHANRTQGLSSDYAKAMEKCVLLERKLSDEANEKLELIKRCETSEALRAELQAQLDGDTSRLVKEKDELQEAVDRLNSAITHRDQVIQSERQQTKMLQEFMRKMNEDIKKKEEESAIRMASLAVGSLDELKGQIEALSLEKAALKADLSQKIDLFLETDDMRERKEKENLSRIALLEKELLEAKMKKSDNEQILELENQVEFSKSIIATQQHKIEKLMEEISQINNALGQEGFEVQFEKKKKKREQKVVRKYCDICEQFDQHDTEDCPSQTLGPDEIQHHTRTSLDSDEGQKLKSKKGWIRKFCDHCDQFDLHDTEDCPNPQQF
ncbi:hypothetical protein QR680_006086 [Steinernema hermaphroditum]|uniref:CAP-Gly domain-containing protein n=1 Tax=Steinernema hermaphroditum TaxID=289476 RepID=A0AA39LWH9_9BILA|nr:hypothetical protein QR680_006086 [Steinernema hermaphroditum]